MIVHLPLLMIKLIPVKNQKEWNQWVKRLEYMRMYCSCYFRYIQHSLCNIKSMMWDFPHGRHCLQHIGQKSYTWFQNRTSAQHEFDLKSQVWFQSKIAQPEVQLPLDYIHFEIAQFNCLDTRTTRTTKVAKFAKQWPFCLSFSCNVID